MSDSNEPAPAPATRDLIIGHARGLAGALAGAAVGYFLFKYLVESRGLVLFAMPGALIGLGRSVLYRKTSWVLAALCGAISLAVPIYIAETDFNDGVSGLTNASKLAIFFSGAIGTYLGLGRLWAKGW